MDRLLARMERRFGWLAVEHLTLFIVGGMAIVYVLGMTRPGVLDLLVLDPRAVARGQVWRLVTYLFIPSETSPLWFLVTLYWMWMVGSNLESEWGAFKYTAYYFLGMVGTTAAALLTGEPQGNLYLNASLFFAFATLFPDLQILVFFLIPLPVKILGWLAFAAVAFAFAVGDWGARAAIVAALANYLLFFWPSLLGFLRGGRRVVAGPRRAPSMRPPPTPASEQRVCALCGKRESDGEDIRVCSCEKCKEANGGKARSLCLEHARTH